MHSAIVRVGALMIGFRIAGLAERYLVQPDIPFPSRLALFAPAVMAHAGALLLIIAVFLIAARILPRRRRAVSIAACATFATLVVAGQADFIVSSITGAPLTPTVFRTFRGLHVVRSNEFLEPLRTHLALTLSGAAVFIAGVWWMSAVIRSDGAVSAPAVGRRARWTPEGFLFAAAMALSGAAAVVPWPVPPPPIEVAFAREYLGLDRVRLRQPEAEAIGDLRAFVGLPAGASWATDVYPLVYRPAPDPAAAGRRASPPDVVVVMIESLRAQDVGFVGGAADSATPAIDRLAQGGVAFPTYVSNGFPSAPSVFAFHCSAWPHRRKEIMTDFAGRGFDSLPARLRTLGYDSVYVGADPHFDNQSLWLPRWYAKVVDLVAEGGLATDHTIISRAMDEIRAHDRGAGRQPLFAFVSTYSTHYPFTLPVDAGEAAAGGDLSAQYRQTLRYSDREAGRLFDFLAERGRRTVTIVLGDHAFYNDLSRTSGVPENDNVWTPAIISGPADLVGPPRRLAMPASHVDMMPTVLRLVGDDRPTASLGSDLLASSRSPARTAFAIRPGGLRLDRGGYSIVLDARAPNIVTTRVPFPSLLPPSGTPERVPSAASLMSWATDWSYLIEQNRVWSDALLR